jgi:hypothetical protein
MVSYEFKIMYKQAEMASFAVVQQRPVWRTE